MCFIKIKNYNLKVIIIMCKIKSGPLVTKPPPVRASNKTNLDNQSQQALTTLLNKIVETDDAQTPIIGKEIGKGKFVDLSA